MEWLGIIFIIVLLSALLHKEPQHSQVPVLPHPKEKFKLTNTYSKVLLCSSGELSHLQIIAAIKCHCAPEEIAFMDNNTILCKNTPITELWGENSGVYDIVYMEPNNEDWKSRGWDNPEHETERYRQEWREAYQTYCRYRDRAMQKLQEDQSFDIDFPILEEDPEHKEPAQIINFPTKRKKP